MNECASVWPQGGLFAFSGVDGPTCHDEPFVASGLDDAVGWSFWPAPRTEVQPLAGAVALHASRHPNDICLSDCWRFACVAGDYEGQVAGAFVDRASLTLEVTFPSLPSQLMIDLAVDSEREAAERVRVKVGDGWWMAISTGPPSRQRRFGIGISYCGESEAVDRANNAFTVDLDTAIQSRLNFYEQCKKPEGLCGSTRRAFFKALAVLKVNTESPQHNMPHYWTTPDRMPHRHMWMWDSAFTAVGLNHIRPDLARDAIRSLLDKQQPDGRLPLAARPEPEREREIDVSDDVSLSGGESQPPVIAWAVGRIMETAENAQTRPDVTAGHTDENDRDHEADSCRTFLEDVYPGLVRYIEWFETNRKRPNGLYGWHIRTEDDPVRGARGAESGMDNSPRFDDIEEITAVDLSSYMAAEYQHLQRIARKIGRNRDVEVWRERRDKIAELVNELLWDDEDRFYYDLCGDGHFIPVKTSAGLTPLLAGIPCGDKAEALRLHITSTKEFWAQFPFPSVATDEDSFSSDMWRGPTWPNMNMLMFDGLHANGFFHEAHELARRTVTELTRCYMRYGCLYEFYDALTERAPALLSRKGGIGDKGGAGFGVVRDLNWTAAAMVHFVCRTG